MVLITSILFRNIQLLETDHRNGEEDFSIPNKPQAIENHADDLQQFPTLQARGICFLGSSICVRNDSCSPNCFECILKRV